MMMEWLFKKPLSPRQTKAGENISKEYFFPPSGWKVVKKELNYILAPKCTWF